MHDRHRQIENRLGRAMDERIRPAIYGDRAPLTVTAWRTPGEPVSFEVATAAGTPYEPLHPGDWWGRAWDTLWLHVTGEVPADWAGRRVEAVIDPGFGGGPGFTCEGLAYLPDGTPVKGLHPESRYLPIRREGSGAGRGIARGGERLEWYVELGANPDIMGDNRMNTPQSDVLTRRSEPLFAFRGAELAVLREEVAGLALDLQVLGDLMHSLAFEDPRRATVTLGIERALDALDYRDVPGTAAAARSVLAPLLAAGAHETVHHISAIGNAHIDTAWLWPLRETRRKVARTFASALDLMRDYPGYLFAAPQAQQYAWLKEAQPTTYAEVKGAVGRGRWVPTGGAWVEADGNLPGSEALARQLVHGKRFFRREFGVTTRGVWLPDSFGYTAAYPQVARLAGNDWFLTQKLSWNQTNAFPHHTFWWEGIDGTRIFTHFPPADTYNGSMNVEDVQRASRQFRDKGGASRSLYPFGYGDGGGGPTREMLERHRRMADLEGLPRVTIEPPDQFFAAAVAEYGEAAPVWAGELYLELHRGTLTTQARSKAFNRRCEHLLREAELWSTSAAVLGAGFAYPYDDLDRLWKTVLTLQFHDILPGSSITWVHREAEATYAAVVAELEGLIARAAAALPGASGASGWAGDTAEGAAGADASGGPAGHRVLNAAPFLRAEVVAGPDGPAFAVAPASSAGTLREAPRVHSVTVERGGAGDDSAIVLVNGSVRVTLTDGLVTSLQDLREPAGSANLAGLAPRELVPAGHVANLLQVHPDVPNDWDAWDIERHYRNTVEDLAGPESLASMQVVAEHPLEARVEVVRRYRASTITQTYVLRAGSPRLDVVTVIDWRERERLLKAAFPLAVHAETERSEIQYGHVQRPTHENTSWDWARFEACAHRWIHVDEGAGAADFGVGLLTDSTYGHDVTRSVATDGSRITTVRLTLLRSPNGPDPSADAGRHELTYAISPGDVAATIREGYALNLPLRVVPATAAGAGQPPPAVAGVYSEQGAVVEAVKLADDRSGDVIVRLYEAYGGRARARISAPYPLADVLACDLLEEPLEGPLAPVVRQLSAESYAAVREDRWDVALRPFQIATLRLRRAGS
ncbi:MAG: alpha-mannosidase [Austwickia sp.]|jgi:alpha-mannosidase|nr:MAG: alpha-mannosidase [Austwickia sp.]